MTRTVKAQEGRGGADEMNNIERRGSKGHRSLQIPQKKFKKFFRKLQKTGGKIKHLERQARFKPQYSSPAAENDAHVLQTVYLRFWIMPHIEA